MSLEKSDISMRTPLFRISGTIDIGLPPGKTHDVADLRQEIAAFLGRRTESKVVRISPKIWLNRGYLLWPYHRDPLTTFDPVEISIQLDPKRVSLHYILGLRPLYFPLVVFLAAICISIYFGEFIITALTYSILLVFFLAAFLMRLSLFRRWLRDVVSSVVDFAAD
jgi:hypothetical protein